MSKTRILVAGIGGVGGYFGGLLAHEYEGSQEVEVLFLARGEHLKAIRKSGLLVKKGATEFVAKPQLVTDTPDEEGVVDYLILATKSYDLENTLDQLRPCVDSNTVLLPLLNGVDSRERILTMFPNNSVCDGCVYIIARRTDSGVVENKGNIQKLFFGNQGGIDKRLELLNSILAKTTIESTLTEDIQSVIWRKYIFISSIATATTYFDTSIGALLEQKSKADRVKELIDEVSNLARSKGIAIESDFTAVTLQKLNKLPYESTSSMHSEFLSGTTKTELEALTHFVVKEGKRYEVPTPEFQHMYTKLQLQIDQRKHD